MVPNEAYFIALQTGECPLATGWPGCAKTASFTSFCQHIERKLYVLIGSIRDPSDFGIPFLEAVPVDHVAGEAKVPFKDTDGRKKIAHFVLAAPKWAADTFDGNKWVVLMDELTNCAPAIQAGLLRFMAENWVGDLEMPKDLWKAALCNPTNIATNGFDIEPAMANRMCHLRWTMDWDGFDSGMSNGLKFPAPRYPIVPDNWRDNLGQVGSMFKAFRMHRPDAFHPPLDAHGNVNMERSKMSGPWPSPRSWTIAARLRAAALSVGAEREVMLDLLEGCVGPAAHEYEEWETHLDLPNPELALQAAVDAIAAQKPVPYKHPNRPDKVIAHLGAVIARVTCNRTDANLYNVKRWEAALHIVEEAAKFEKDVAISCCRNLFRNESNESIMPKGAAIHKSFREGLQATIQAALTG